jgi:hypothetical protein
MEVDLVVDPGPSLAAADVSEKLLQLGVVIRSLCADRGEGSGASAAPDGEGKREARPLGRGGGHGSILMSNRAFI